MASLTMSIGKKISKQNLAVIAEEDGASSIGTSNSLNKIEEDLNSSEIEDNKCLVNCLKTGPSSTSLSVDSSRIFNKSSDVLFTIYEKSDEEVEQEVKAEEPNIIDIIVIDHNLEFSTRTSQLITNAKELAIEDIHIEDVENQLNTMQVKEIINNEILSSPKFMEIWNRISEFLRKYPPKKTKSVVPIK